ncbi:MAG: helix-turn-helix transcriptional regulator [Bacteroidota bacterium]
MKDSVKEIEFVNRKTKNSYFDLVPLQKILSLKPKDHNQFEHHKVGFYVLLFVTDGNGIHSVNYDDFPFTRGTVFSLRKHTIHKFYKSGAKGKLLIFTEDFAIRFSNRVESLRLFQLFNELLGSAKLQLRESEFEEIQVLVNQIEKEYFLINDNESIEIIRNLVQAIVLRLFRVKSKIYHNLSTNNSYFKFTLLQELVENECFDHKKVTYYASKMGVTPKTLSNITKKMIGKSAKAFIDEILILQIKRLLANTQLSISEIAYRSGFDEPTNFFKYFRKRTGYSPKSFRVQLEEQ